MSFRGLLNKTVTVSRKTRTSDGGGGYTNAWATVYSAMPCRIQALSGNEIVNYGGEAVEATHKMFCERIYTFAEADQVVDGSVTYDIQFVDDDTAGALHHQEVVLRRRK